MAVRQQLAKLRERMAAQGLARTASYLVFTVIGERAGLEVNAAFQFRLDEEASEPDAHSFEVVRDLTGFSDEDLCTLRGYGGEPLIARFALGFDEGELCVLGRVNGELANVCWVVPQEYYGAAIAEPSVTVERCFTLPAYRGRGLFPDALKYIRAHISRTVKTRVFIEASVWNAASVRGISKSGCARVGTKVSWHGREAFIPLAAPQTA